MGGPTKISVSQRKITLVQNVDENMISKFNQTETRKS